MITKCNVDPWTEKGQWGKYKGGEGPELNMDSS